MVDIPNLLEIETSFFEELHPNQYQALLTHNDKHFAARCAWEITRKKIQRLTELKARKFERFKCWYEFKGFLAGRFLTEVPEAWINCLQFGSCVDLGEGGFYFGEIAAKNGLRVEFDSSIFEIYGNTAISQGVILKVDDAGSEIWRSIIPSTNISPKVGTTGNHATDFLQLAMSNDKSSLFLWGFNNNGFCYLYEYEIKTGNRIGILLLKLDERVFREVRGQKNG